LKNIFLNWLRGRP